MCESVCVCVHETPRDEEQLVYQGDGWGGPILKHPPPPRHWVYRLSSVSGIKTHIYKHRKTSVKKCVRLVIHVPKKYQIIFKKGRSFNLIFTSSFTSPGIQKLPLLAPVCYSLQSKRSSPSTIAAQKLLPVIKKGEKNTENENELLIMHRELFEKSLKRNKKNTAERLRCKNFIFTRNSS